MPTESGDVTVRAFTPDDHEQVTDLVNAHVSAVIPGSSISRSRLLSTLEREPGEFMDDPWVIERVTLVAEQRHRIVAAAHLQRFSDSPDAPEGLRDISGFRWLLCWPATTFWPDSADAGEALLEAGLAVIQRWQSRVVFADGNLPVPGVYGIPDQWPHIRSLLSASGFTSGGRSERILMCRVSELPDPKRNLAPRGVSIQRTVGHVGTRLTAVDGDGRDIGMIELDTTLDAAAPRSQHENLADIGNLRLDKGYVKGAGPWLMGQARQWLELAGVTRLLAYIQVSADDAEAAQQKFLLDNGFQVITTTVRDLTRPR